MHHPYIPNSEPTVRDAMLRELGVATIDELFATIPESLRLNRPLRLPPAITAEADLRRHVDSILARNQSTRELLCFRGGGCAQHYVPAICDEINRRAEFLTAYAGEPYEDHGRFQALFEYASLMGELLDFDVVSIPTFDWNQAASTACRMAQRITGRRRLLVSDAVSPDRQSTMRNYCRSAMRMTPVAMRRETSELDLDDLRAKLGDDVVGIYFEYPGYLGLIDGQAEEVAALIHGCGGLVVVGVDPISLGVLKPPRWLGADIACGDLQPLGMHLQHGGGQAGFIATADDLRFVREFPSRLFSIARTNRAGEWGFGDVLYDERTSFGARERGKEFVGTGAALWAITAAVYLSLMGPNGMRQVGQTIMQQCRYAMNRIAELPGYRVRHLGQPHFKEFVVDCLGTKLTVGEINSRLLRQGIIGGIDLTASMPGYAQCMLLCVTESHNQRDIDRLIDSLHAASANDTN